MRLRQWLGERDRDYAALRRACRTAIVMPGLFALGDLVIDNPDVATFGAFGAFAMILLVDFGGPMPARLQAQAALVVVGGVFVCLGTLVSQTIWLAAIAMAVVAFAVLFAGVVSSVLASATTALLLASILPVSIAAPATEIPARLAGWGLAGACSLIAVGLAWPAPVRDPLRAAAASACLAHAGRIRADVALLLGGSHAQLAADRDRAIERSDEAAAALQKVFLGTPYRPTALGTAARMIMHLAGELSWVHTILSQVRHHRGATVSRPSCGVKIAAAQVLESGADVLTGTSGDTGELQAAFGDLSARLASLEDGAAADLPDGLAGAGPAANGAMSTKLISALDPAFRATELSFAVSLIARSIELTSAAERRSWLDRVLGPQPAGLSGTLATAEIRAASHADPHSVWLRNSVRGAVGLGLAILLARLTGVQHSFWVVLGALSVLRSNALSTGQQALRALAGTVAGLLIGAGIVLLVGTHDTVLWAVLPVAVFAAGVAPAVISFAGGQAAFTVTLVVLFNIIVPAGWTVGLLRLQDIALGCGVSIAVGLLFWPRGAAALLRQALADAYESAAAYLASAVHFGVRVCTADGVAPHAAASSPAAHSRDLALRAAAAARRLDDAFRAYLTERGSKALPLADLAGLVTGASGLRLTADAVLGLWERDSGRAAAERTAARSELLAALGQVRGWYDEFATRLVSRQEIAAPQSYDEDADGRLADAVRHDLDGGGADAAATAVRIVWTGDHLDAARRLEGTIVPPGFDRTAGRA
jgi:uncharacterized membrane protein YccC